MSGDRAERLKAGLGEALAIILVGAFLAVLLTGSP